MRRGSSRCLSVSADKCSIQGRTQAFILASSTRGGDDMRDSEKQRENDETPMPAPLPEGEKFFDPWEEEFRQNFSKDDKDFDF